MAHALLYQVDAFTDRPFSGNPAAVCLLPGPRDDRWMQDLAREMNLSDTAFLEARADGFGLRWFTPGMEADLCGHATLASAHVLWEQGMLSRRSAARFHTRSGCLTARSDGDWIRMDFPSTPPSPVDDGSEIGAALGLAVVYVGDNGTDVLVEVAAEEDVRRAAPDMRRLARVEARGVMVTARADGAGADFVSRFFAPASGIDEDSVTGSAHCCLGPYWGRRLGRTRMTGYQASARGGFVEVELADDRVVVSGQAVTVFKAELVV